MTFVLSDKLINSKYQTLASASFTNYTASINAWTASIKAWSSSYVISILSQSKYVISGIFALNFTGSGFSMSLSGTTASIFLSGSSGTGLPAGSDTEIQLNSSSVFGANNNLTFNIAGKTFNVGYGSWSTQFKVDGTNYNIIGKTTIREYGPGILVQDSIAGDSIYSQLYSYDFVGNTLGYFTAAGNSGSMYSGSVVTMGSLFNPLKGTGPYYRFSIDRNSNYPFIFDAGKGNVIKMSIGDTNYAWPLVLPATPANLVSDDAGLLSWAPTSSISPTASYATTASYILYSDTSTVDLEISSSGLYANVVQMNLGDILAFAAAN